MTFSDYENIKTFVYQGHSILLENPKYSKLLLQYKNSYIHVIKQGKKGKAITEKYYSFRNGNDELPDLETYCKNWKEMVNDSETKITIAG